MKKRTNFHMRILAMVMGFAMVMSLAGQCFAAKSLPTSKVNINTASAEQLMELPGIGKSKAQAIVSYRSTTPFKATEELVNVKGIGDKLLAKISSYVTVSGGGSRAGTAAKATR